MARNWKPGEAAEAIASKNLEETIDIGRRYPLFTVLAAQLNDSGRELLNALPEYLSVRKLESTLKGEVEEGETPETEEKAEPAAKETKKAAKPAAKEEVEEDEDEEVEEVVKSAKDLFKECQAKGIKVEPKKEAAYYSKALAKYDDDIAKAAKAAKTKKTEEVAGKATKAKAKTEEEEDWDI